VDEARHHTTGLIHVEAYVWKKRDEGFRREAAEVRDVHPGDDNSRGYLLTEDLGRSDLERCSMMDSIPAGLTADIASFRAFSRR
jgi:hypothetical protein